MKILLFLCLIVVSVYCFPFSEGDFDFKAPATPCNDTCKAPACRCSSVTIPGGLTAATTPQLVVITFDDNINPINIEYYRDAFYNRKNPNNCSISGTFFITHEYCDYELVHELHSKGFEIGLHSISKESTIAYWKDASVETLTKEFADQKLLINKFANIPLADLKGIRMPFLQMAGNNQYKMLHDNKFLYDITWTTQNYIQPGLWAYTMDHSSIQECLIPPCPTDSFPGLWTVPMINWIDTEGVVCAMADGCVNIPNTTDGIVDWMKNEFNRQYKGNKAPVGLYMHAAWFDRDEINFAAYKGFLDYLATLKDVYIVSVAQAIDWIKAPKPIAQMNTFSCPATHAVNCTPRLCELDKGGVPRWMKLCDTQCPKSYPWVGNPLGTN